MSNTGSLTIKNNIPGLDLLISQVQLLNSYTTWTQTPPAVGSVLSTTHSFTFSFTASGARTSQIAISFFCNNAIGNIVFSVPFSLSPMPTTISAYGNAFSFTGVSDTPSNNATVEISLATLVAGSATVSNSTAKTLDVSYNNQSPLTITAGATATIAGFDPFNGAILKVTDVAAPATTSLINLATLYCGDSCFLIVSQENSSSASFSTGLQGTYPASGPQFSITLIDDGGIIIVGTLDTLPVYPPH